MSKNGKNSQNGKGNDNFLSRDDVLGGQLDRRPQRALALIEARCQYLRQETRRAIEAYFLSEQAEFERQFDTSYFVSLKMQVQAEHPVTAADLEHYAPNWRALAPAAAEDRAVLVHLLAEKYPLAANSTPRLQDALDFAQPELQTAYQERYGQPLETVFRQAEEMPAPAVSEAAGADPALEDAVANAEWLNLPDGEVLYAAGEDSDSLYIVISGRLRSVVTPPEAAAGESGRVITELGRGELVGELEVLTGEPRTAQVYAIRDSELVRLPQAELQRLAEKYPQVMFQVNRILARRLQAHLTNPERKRTSLQTFAVVPAAASAEQAGEFTRRFVRGLEADGPVLHLDAQRVDDALGRGVAHSRPDDADYSRLAAWLSEQETTYRYVVYEAEREPSEWTLRSIRQADRILLLAEASANPNLSRTERALGDANLARKELVLLHPASTSQPAGTRHWLERRQVQAHHHVRQDNDQDLGRLVRRLTGRAVGLVLGGGGARGFAHVGVYEALRQSGFQVDLLGGTSMGAILGGAYAKGMDTDQLIKISRKLSSPFKLFDPTLPVVSFFSSEKVTNALQDIFGEIYIEDLWHPYFCISSNLTRAVAMVHDRGPLWQAARASSAIPGVFSPVLHEGELLVDGAVLNNLPVDVMKDFSQGGPIIAVNVFPEVDLVKSYRFGNSVSGLSALINKLNPLSKDFEAPLLFENLLRVIALNDVHQARAKSKLAELYFRPPVERYNILDFRSYAPIIEIGYENARQEIAAWQRTAGRDSKLRRSLPATPASQLESTLRSLEVALAEL